MPTMLGNVHVDRPLTDFAMNYRPQGFIAERVFTNVNVPKQSDLFVNFSQADIFRIDEDRRAPGTEANKTGVRIGSMNFNCINYALKTEVTQEERANADPIFMAWLEQGRVAFTMDKLLLSREQRVASIAFSTSFAGSNAAVASSWSDQITGHSDPMGDFWRASDVVYNSTGYRPNVVVMGINPYNAFRRHQDVVTKATNPNYLGGGNYPDTQKIAQLLEVDEVLVGAAQANTAQEGLNMTLARIWGNSVLALYRPPGARLDAPTFGVNFVWTGAPVPPWAARRFPFDEKRGVDEIQIDYYGTELGVNSAFGFILTGCSSLT